MSSGAEFTADLMVWPSEGSAHWAGRGRRLHGVGPVVATASRNAVCPSGPPRQLLFLAALFVVGAMPLRCSHAGYTTLESSWGSFRPSLLPLPVALTRRRSVYPEASGCCGELPHRHCTASSRQEIGQRYGQWAHESTPKGLAAAWGLDRCPSRETGAMFSLWPACLQLHDVPGTSRLVRAACAMRRTHCHRLMAGTKVLL
jgi:hypothetical protein